MCHSTSLILLLWLVMAQCTSTADVSGAHQNVRGGLDKLPSLTNRSLSTDGNVGESLVTSPVKEVSLTNSLLSSDIDAEEKSTTIEPIEQKLLVPATEAAMNIHLDIDVDAKETSATVDKDQQRSTTKHPTHGTETVVGTRPLGVGGDAKNKSVTLDTVHMWSTTELPIPVTEALQNHNGPSASATKEQLIWILKISISTTEVPQTSDVETTPLNTIIENSEPVVPSTETLQTFDVESAGDHNWTAVNERVLSQDQNPKVHKKITSHLTSTTTEENEGASHKRSPRSLALLMVPIVNYLVRRAATMVSTTIGELVSGAASYVGFGPKPPADANATTSMTAGPAGG